MTDHHHVFLSYSRNDQDAAVNLRGQLERHGLAVFRDEESIREGELWLNRLKRENISLISSLIRNLHSTISSNIELIVLSIFLLPDP